MSLQVFRVKKSLICVLVFIALMGFISLNNIKYCSIDKSSIVGLNFVDETTGILHQFNPPNIPIQAGSWTESGDFPNTPGSAEFIGEGTVTGSCLSGDEDWFKLTIPANYRIEVSLDAGIEEAGIALYNSTDQTNSIEFDSTYYGATSISHTWSTEMIYAYIKVSENTNLYSMTIVFSSNYPAIAINGTAELDSFSPKTGAGTVQSPYIIQGHNIRTLKAFGSDNVSLALTNIQNRYVILQNFVIENIYSDYYSTSNLIRIENCSNIIFRDSIIRNVLQFQSHVSLMNLNQSKYLTISNITICNLVRNFYGYTLINNLQTNSSIFNGINVLDCQNSESSASLIVFKHLVSKDNRISNLHVKNITNSEIFIFSVILCGDTWESGNNTIENVLVEDITGYRFTGFSLNYLDNFIVQNIIMRNIYSTTTIIMCYLEQGASGIIFRNGSFINLYAESYIYGFQLETVVGLQIDSFLFKNWNPSTTNQNMYIIGIYCIGVDNSKFLRNWFEELTAPSSQSYCVLLTSDSQLNSIAYNSFLAGFTPVWDGCNNTYSAYLFFTPLKCYTYVGNYWGDHCVDANNDRHYFMSEPKNVNGLGCNKDYYAIHYFAMDFDNDKLLNYDELEANTDPSIADTDGDGDNDYQEYRVLKTDPLNVYSNSTSQTINTNQTNSNSTTIIIMNYPSNDTSSSSPATNNSTSTPSTTESNFLDSNLFQSILIAASIIIAGLLFGRKTPITIKNDMIPPTTNFGKNDEILKNGSQPDVKSTGEPKVKDSNKSNSNPKVK